MQPIRIKVLARTAADQSPALWLSLFEGREPRIGDCEFIFDLDSREYDFLAVYEDLTFLPGETRSNRAEKLSCARANTLFITTEPTSIKVYGPHYLRQFGHVMTQQPAHIVRHPGQIPQTPPLRWFYGRPLGDPNGAYIDVDEFKAAAPPPKTGELSAVCSDKQMTVTLKQRYDFIARLKERLGEDFDWFGRGIRPINDKAEAMDSFKYHIAIENHIEPHHWTEKIADCYLAFCLPFYYGPPNMSAYFPKDSFIPIDIFKVDEAAKIIQDAIENNAYEARLPAIIKARDKVLSDYNLMQAIAKIAVDKFDPAARKSGKEFIYGRHIFRQKHPLRAGRDALHKVKYKST